jgi:DNA-binding HxlR family transcriptional regulator
MALLGGPRRYFELKQLVSGAGTNILSDRLRALATNGLVSRTTGNEPGSETRYHLTERGAQLGPVIAGVATWGLELLKGTATGSQANDQVVFDRSWTVDAATGRLQETYQWNVDGVDFELAVRGDKLVRTPGRATDPAATLTAGTPALGDIVTGRRSVAELMEEGQVRLKGSRVAIRRMFVVVGFPLARLGF